MKRWLWLSLTGVVLLALGATTAWAVLTVLRPAEDPAATSNQGVYATVQEGQVGDSLSLNTVAEWQPVPAGVNRAVGVVTGVSITPGSEVGSGDELYTVDLRPVRVAAGDVPMFRAIGADAEGPDVAQVQRMLSELGFYGGPADGKAGVGTVRAIERWQKATGVEVTAIVEPGDVIFVPSLPGRIALTEEIVAGATLAGGEEVVRALPSAPDFRIPVTDTQASLLTTGSRVAITSPNGDAWEALVADQVRDESSGTVVVRLQGPNGTTICAEACAQVPVTGQTTLTSQIILAETVSGLVVPSSALVAGADGSLSVIDESGARLPVDVLASAKGMSVVDGVEVGLRVRVPGSDNGQQ